MRLLTGFVSHEMYYIIDDCSGDFRNMEVEQTSAKEK